MPLSSFCRSETLVKPAASMRDFAWPSVKLLAPSAGVVAVRVPSSTRAAALLSVVRFGEVPRVRVWGPAGTATPGRVLSLVAAPVVVRPGAVADGGVFAGGVFEGAVVAVWA